MYKLNLFKTTFKLADTHVNSAYPALWATPAVTAHLHQTQADRPLFLLHDGPPYANGALHMGHFVNKTLKDAALKFKRAQGYFAPFVPGFDCHGLPVELEVEKQGVSKDNPQAFVAACRAYAMTQVALQTSQFQSFGVAADWKNAYRTLDVDFEYNAAKLFSTLGAYQRLRPVHWCAECGSSLAEAEVEYHAKKSPSLTVLFPVVGEENTFFEVWTTTPHTLPANQAVAFNEHARYAAFSQAGRTVVRLAAEGGDTFEMANRQALSPYSGAEVPVVVGDFVTTSGTGLVHLAPSFGTDDFRVGLRYGLHASEWVSDDGTFLAGALKGMTLSQAGDAVVAVLREKDLVVELTTVNHEYPFCWRHKKPTFFKASKEWFLGLDEVGPKALAALDQVAFVPASGRDRLAAMLESRPAWCVSRNRAWGTPLVDPSNPEDVALLEQVKAQGVEAWQSKGLRKTLDVWFDSGVTHAVVLAQRFGRHADVYLEGSDQHRGWFQSSLLTAAAAGMRAPYETLVTHGFVVDEKGLKLSKSNKNYTPMEKLMAKYGPDALRLWVLQQDFTKELKFSDAAMALTLDRYKKLRNTLRFCLQNLQDFDWVPRVVTHPAHLAQLGLLQQVSDNVMAATNTWDFSKAVRELMTMAEALSSDYFTLLKDSLYCDAVDSDSRREAQYTLSLLLDRFLVLLTPVLSFSCEEAYQELAALRPSAVPSVLMLSLEDAPLPAVPAEVVTGWGLAQAWRAKAQRKVQELQDSGTPTASTEQMQVQFPVEAESVVDQLLRYHGYAAYTRGPLQLERACLQRCDCCRREYSRLNLAQLCARCETVQHA